MTVTLTTQTLQALLAGQGTWRGGIEQGRIVVENCPLGREELESVLAGLFSSQQPDPRFSRPLAAV